jgi:broad specificity phosphatase PhoE
VAGRYQGQLDESVLTPRGELQAAALANALCDAGLSAIVSSPLRRCVQTGATVAQKLSLKLTTEPLLCEIGHGTWEGLLKDEIEREDPRLLALWRERPYDVAFTGGESLQDVTERWRAFRANFHAPGPTLIMTHDVLVRLALIESGASARGDFWKIVSTNGAFAVFDVGNGRWDLVDPYVDAHLSGLRADTSAQAL